MKKSIRRLVLTNLVLVFSFSLIAQNVTLNYENVSLKVVFASIKKQTGLNFSYSTQLVNPEKAVSINVINEPVESVVKQLLNGTNLTFEKKEKNILLFEKPKPIDDKKPPVSKKITGLVTDEKGEPIIGASVIIKGTNIGTITNLTGEFSLDVTNQSNLTISYIGYKSVNTKVSSAINYKIVLEEDNKSLTEVVVVGYGVQKKGTLTSSVSVIKSDAINSSPVANVTNSLVGKTPGLIVRNTNAVPGSDASTISVRGISTTGDNSALIVVDGIPGRSMTQIDMNDIESVSVLKDASAVAPYGARGANGVILITTKRGKSGKPTINYDMYYGTSQPTILPQFASSADYARMQNEAAKNEGKTIMPFTEDDILKYESGTDPNYPNTNWWDAILVDNPIQAKHHLSLSGATENVKYYLSLGTFRQDGYIGNTNYNRYNTRANIDANVTKDFVVSFELAGNFGDRNRPIANLDASMTDIMERPMRIPGIWPVMNSQGVYVTPTMTPNPAAEIALNGGKRDRIRSFNGTFKAEYKPSFFNGLTLTALGVYDAQLDDSKTWLTPYASSRLIDRVNGIYEPIAPAGLPSLTKYSSYLSTRQLEFHVDYKKTFDNHTIGALWVYNQSQWNGNDLSGKRINYISSVIDELFAGAAEGQLTSGSAWEGARMGHVGRLTYDFQSKYLIEANFRYDGSMNFPKGNRWGFFPSFAAGWRISEEGFIKNNLTFIDNLKLRGSWGKAGNDRISGFQYLGSYSYNNPYTFAGKLVQTASESRLPNPDITWEKGTLTDIGMDASFWKGKLTLEVDYFKKKTADILRPTQTISSIIGVNLPDANIGIVDNSGVEFMLGHTNKISDFKYNAEFVFTYATNKAVELGEAIGTLNDPFRRITGNPLNSYYGYIAEGLFTTTEEIASSPVQGTGIVPGDIKYRDFSGPQGAPDGKIDSYDQTKIGYSNVPEIIFGFNLGASYKGVELTANFQGATHMNYLFSNFAANAFDNGGNIQVWQMENRWTVENNNPAARYPRLTSSPKSNNTKASTFWLRDGSYLRLRTAQIAYSFDKSLLKKVNIQGLRIYLSGQNIFTLVKDKLNTFDPEAYNDRGQFYPQSKVYTIGLNLTF